MGSGGFAETSQAPFVGLQVWPPGQLTGVPEQVPAEQASLVVQRLASLQDAVLLACTQPVPVLQESSVQGLESSQFGAAPPTQRPPAQASFAVQALPSLQATVLFVCEQPVAGMQVSVVQTLPSSQFGAVPA